MSTHALIAQIIDEDTIKAIYCHFDGYLKGVGKTLIEHYDITKTKELIDLGNISYLGIKVKPEGGTHSFNTPEENVTVAYGRDRKEQKQDAIFLNQEDDLIKQRTYDVTWFYLLNTDGVWMVKNCNWESWIPLIDALNIK